MKSTFLILFIMSTFLIPATDAQGVIKGRVTDKETKSPLIGVNIFVKNTGSGTTTDSEGNYELTNVPLGLVNIVFSYIGYESASKTDIVVKPGRPSILNIEMYSSPVKMKDVLVTNGYFSELENKPLSTTNFSSEEIRRSPGTAGDVSRIFATLPSIAKLNDQRNSLIVRGGTAVENSFYIDNIEIPNINHFPSEGSTDGAIGILNVDFINDVNFYSGGFSPVYGDKLSSVMDISLREGSQRISPQVNLNMTGVGAAIEGPVGNNGNYLLSLNRSYIDIIINQIEEGAPLPVYGDVQGKISYKINDNNRISFLNILSLDKIYMDQDKAVDNKSNMFGKTDGATNTSGLNWQHIWSERGFSNTSLSYTYTKYNLDYSKTADLRRFYTNSSAENMYKLRNVNYIKINTHNSTEFGVDLSGAFTKYNTFYGEYADQFGNITPELNVGNKMNAFKIGFFAVHHINFGDFNFDYGTRFDFFTYNRNFNFSPRAMLSYKLNPKTTLSAGAGVFHQSIPNNILVQSEKFKSLKTPQAIHYTAGMSHSLSNATRLSVEAYLKNYNNFPINPSQPAMFLFDQTQVYGIFWSNEILEDKGKADSKGIEVILQKKLAVDFYGIISGSVSKSTYQDYNGNWYNRIYDNRFNVNLEGGYIPDNEWEFKIRWVYAGGAPYTPFDYNASKNAGVGIWDLTRTNSERLPDYHSMNIRIDKKFYFENSNLLVYLSVWNVYNRKNIAFYYWNEVNNDLAAQKQWSVLPVIGIEYEL